ncbi:TPA: triose-phosphate isomerase [archaeon]|nr:triose-phosphate isomerase [Candidatus Undinarchaeales archaeon SRR5007147.bin71]
MIGKREMAFILLNLKAYEQGVGKNAENLSSIAREVSESSGERIIIASQATDIQVVSKLIETFAQHVDSAPLGAQTGSILPESAKAAGARGSLLNHAEQQISDDDIKTGVARLKSLEMESMVCASSPELAAKYAEYGPTYIAIEPPELIGSGVSVSTANPDIVTDSIEKVKAVNPSVKVVCGAGISSGEDVRKAIELGSEGALAASAFVKADDPKAVLEDLVGGLK